MFCPSCGNKIRENSKFCNKCGLQIGYRPNYQTHHAFGAQPKQQKSNSAPWIIGIVMAVIALGAVFALVYITPKDADPAGNTVEDSASFSTQLLPGFTFDDAEINEEAGAPLLFPIVNDMAPASGTVGTTVQIGGSNLTGVQSVMLGETELSIDSVGNQQIDVYIPYGAVSGNVSLVYDGQTIDAGAFEVLPQKKQLLAEQTITPSADAQTVSSDTISVTIPGGALTQAQTVRIESIADPQPVNLPDTVSGTAFSVTAGDMHAFDDIVLIDFVLQADMPGEPSAAYFNETTSLWDTLPSEVVDGKLFIYTDHLTDFFVFYWGKAIYSPDGYFKIHYHEDDAFSYAGANNMDDMAKQIGETLEEARKKYEAKIPKAYREDFSYFGMVDAMDVYLDSGYDKGTYKALTNNILLPTDYTDATDFKTMPAHEMFHAYQDAVWNEIKGIGKMSRSQNLWAVEAIAELAAYELAFPEFERHIKFAAAPKAPYHTFGESHEYDMSCFLQYLLKETNSQFEDMWMSVAGDDYVSLDASLAAFFKSRSADFISLDMSYLDFWKDVLCNADAPVHDAVQEIFEKEVAFAQDKHTTAFEYQTASASTATYDLFAVKKYSDNMPLRIFNVSCTGERATCTQVPDIHYANALNTVRISGGRSWDSIHTDLSLGDTHRLYTFEQGKDSVVLVGLEAVMPDTLYSVKVSEIQAQCTPQRIDNVQPGQQQKFEVAFKDIFAHVGDVEVVIDFGDGTVKRYGKANETGIFSGWITHTFGEDITGNAVTFSMYDVTGGGSELISRLVIPMMMGEAAVLSVNPNPAAPGDTVTLSTNIFDKGYTYQWDFGNGEKQTTAGVSSVTYTYQNEGTYSASVIVFDQTGVQLGKAKMLVTVAAPENTPPPSETPAASGSEPTADYSYLYGTWTSVSGVFYDMATGNTWRCDQTLEIYADGTCCFNSNVTIVYRREDDPDPYATIPPHDSIGGTMWESESHSGKWGIYDEETFTGYIGGIDFEDGTGGFIGYSDGKLIFESAVFTKSG